MTGQHRPRGTDSNGIPKPVVKWLRGNPATIARCKVCLWADMRADLAVARLHVKTYPDHNIEMVTSQVTWVYAETTDGMSWVEAVNGL